MPSIDDIPLVEEFDYNFHPPTITSRTNFPVYFVIPIFSIYPDMWNAEPDPDKTIREF